MALNPYFIQGSSGEQGLVQDLVNEQLKKLCKTRMYDKWNEKLFDNKNKF